MATKLCSCFLWYLLFLLWLLIVFYPSLWSVTNGHHSSTAAMFVSQLADKLPGLTLPPLVIVNIIPGQALTHLLAAVQVPLDLGHHSLVRLVQYPQEEAVRLLLNVFMVFDGVYL